MKRDLGLVRKILFEAEKSEERFFEIGSWEWADHDMRYRELKSDLSGDVLFHLDLMEQGGLIRKSACEHTDFQFWEITWAGYEFLDAVRDEGFWNRLQTEAKARGVALTVDGALAAFRGLASTVLSVSQAN
ncbi:DUF2513 domain-containing protein [Ruegeria pomeroyi]|uniref:DUF2513 domain-containing protein n=1 Tax=Ruegeria pomeroyi TaxID=89184 RepID=A0A9Q3ZNP1_9RHOB|nr:DUF2513 domain-containing protein [Ruegeria pomeroyi]